MKVDCTCNESLLMSCFTFCVCNGGILSHQAEYFSTSAWVWFLPTTISTNKFVFALCTSRIWGVLFQSHPRTSFRFPLKSPPPWEFCRRQLTLTYKFTLNSINGLQLEEEIRPLNHTLLLTTSWKLSLSPRLWEDFGATGVDTSLDEICNLLQRAWILIRATNGNCSIYGGP